MRRPGAGRVRVVQAVQVPAARTREPGDRVGAGGQQLPELVRVLDATGEPAAHADDRDRFLALLLHLAQAAARLLEIGGDQLQVIAELFIVRHAVAIP